VLDALEVLPGVTVCVEVACPREPAWSAAGDDFVRRCVGLAGAGASWLRLVSDRPGDDAWDHVAAYAEMARLRTGLLAVMDAPPCWYPGSADELTDDGRARPHVAILSGRVDLIAFPWNAREPAQPRSLTRQPAAVSAG